MADISILREYFVRVGFITDERTVKKVDKSLGDLAKRLAELAAAAAAAAAAVAAAVTKVAEQFDGLYYASQRLRSSVENIKAFDFGISQVGGTADGARAALEGLASFMRSNPGGENFLRGMGINTRDANGELRQTTDLMAQLGEKLKAMPFYRAKIYGNMLGLDDNTIMALERGPDLYEKQLHDFAARIHLNMDDGANGAQAFMKSVRTLRMEFGLLITKVGIDLLARVGPQLEKFMIWVANNANLIVARIEYWSNKIVDWGLAILEMAGRVYDFFKDLDTATDGWSTKLILLGAALKMSGLLGLAGSLMAIGPVVAAIVGGIILLGLAFVALKSDYDDWVKTGKSGLGINWPEWSAQIGNLKKDLGDLASAFGAFAKLPIVGQAIDLLVHGALQALDDKIKRITDGLKLMTDLLSGHFGGIPKDILGILAPGMAQGLDQRRGTNSPNGGAFGWLHEHGFFHPQGQDAAGDIDPDAKPQAGVRASRALTDKLQQLRDSLQGLTGGAQAGAAALGTPTVSMATLTPASYTSMLPGAHAPANDHGAPAAALQSIIKFFTGLGWTAAQAAGIAANLDAESGLSTNPAGSNDHGTAYGIAQWHGDRQADFARWAGHAIQGSSLAEQLRFVQYELTQGKRARAGSALAAAHTAAEAARAISELYEGPRGGAAEAARRGDVAENYARRYRLGGDQYAGGGATLHQKTDIAIHGVTDPHAAGREVASAQNRVNGDLVRNLKTAVV